MFVFKSVGDKMEVLPQATNAICDIEVQHNTYARMFV